MQPTTKAIEQIERGFALKREAVALIELIAAEFASDPMSVQCFDSRIVERTKLCAAGVRHLRKQAPFDI